MRTTKMRLLLAAVFAAVVFIPTAAGGQTDAPQQTTVAAAIVDNRCPRGNVSVYEYKKYAQSVYKREKISRKASRKLIYAMKCQHSPWAKNLVKKYWRKFVQARQLRALEDRCTPFGEWAIPPHIVMRESHGTNVPNGQGSDASGYYQILNSTWLGIGGPDISPRPRYLAMSFPKAIQDCVAHRLWNGGANNHWALTR